MVYFIRSKKRKLNFCARMNTTHLPTSSSLTQLISQLISIVLVSHYHYTSLSYRDGALKSLFWVLFDPGQPEKVGCKRNFAGTLGLCVWGLYQIINVVVLLNVCVALMNNTMMKIESNKENMWKFYRTDAWLIFIDDVSLPIPFNIWSLLINWLYRMAGYEKEQTNLTGKRSEYAYAENFESDFCLF